jgi:DNA repair exonuclease SbcCD ATPase subunit
MGESKSETKSMTLEEFTEIYQGRLLNIRDLVLSHQGIPEEMQQHELISALDSSIAELSRTLTGRVGEVNELKGKIANLEKLNRSLQQTNNEYYLQVRAADETLHSRLGGDPSPPKSPKEAHRDALAYIEELT